MYRQQRNKGFDIENLYFVREEYCAYGMKADWNAKQQMKTAKNVGDFHGNRRG